jgi:hypothetical protein
MESNTLFVCQCGDISHQLVVSFDSDPDFRDHIWFQIHLADVGFFKRLKYGIQYIFGKKSMYGDGAFAEVLFGKQQTKQLIDTLTQHYEVMIDGTI